MSDTLIFLSILLIGGGLGTCIGALAMLARRQ